jgi:hypothetical protein
VAGRATCSHSPTADLKKNLSRFQNPMHSDCVLIEKDALFGAHRILTETRQLQRMERSVYRIGSKDGTVLNRDASAFWDINLSE